MAWPMAWPAKKNMPHNEIHPSLTILESAQLHVEKALNRWLESGRLIDDLAVIIQSVADGKSRVASVDRHQFAKMIEPPEDVCKEHPNDAKVIVASKIAAQLRNRQDGFVPAVLNFDADDGALSKVVLLRFVDGKMDVDPQSAGLA